MRAVSTERHQAVQLHFFIVAFHTRDLVDIVFNNLHALIGRARCTQNGSAARENPGEIGLLHLMIFAFNQPLKAVDDPHNLHIVHLLIHRLCDAADRCVQSRAIAARCQDANSCCHYYFLLLKSPVQPLPPQQKPG